MRKIHVLLSFWKNFLILILIESSLDSWILSLESWSWFLELESWNLILDSWNQISFWTLKCSWFNLELILWFLRSSSLLSWSVLDFWAFCHHLCYHQNFFESILIHHEACFYNLPLFDDDNFWNQETHTHTLFPSRSLT